MKEKTKKILLCLGLAGGGASAYFIGKNYIDIKKINNKLVDEIGKIQSDLNTLDVMLDASFDNIAEDIAGMHNQFALKMETIDTDITALTKHVFELENKN